MCIMPSSGGTAGNILLAFPGAKHPKEGSVHVSLYGVNPSSNGPNAIIVVVPTNETMGPEHFINMDGYEGVLGQMREAVVPPRPVMRGAKSLSMEMSQPQVFDVGRLFSVVVAPMARGLKVALSKVPERRRPEISAELAEFLGGMSGNLVIACFDGKEAKENGGVFGFWFRPSYGIYAWWPGLDGHGEIPERNPFGLVRDHTLLLADGRGGVVGYGQEWPWFLPERVAYNEPEVMAGENGDWVLGARPVKVVANFFREPEIVWPE